MRSAIERILLLTAVLLAVDVALAQNTETSPWDRLIGSWKVEFQDRERGVVTGYVAITEPGKMAGVIFYPEREETFSNDELEFDGSLLEGSYYPYFERVRFELALSPDGNTLSGTWTERGTDDERPSRWGNNAYDNPEEPYWYTATGNETWTRISPVIESVTVAPLENGALDYAEMVERWTHAGLNADLPKIALEIRGHNLPVYIHDIYEYFDLEFDDPRLRFHRFSQHREENLLKLHVWLLPDTEPGQKTLTLNGTTVSWKLEFAKEEESTAYFWQAQLPDPSGSNWHRTADVTNWVDEGGDRHVRVPGVLGTEEVYIQGASVVLDQSPVTISRLRTTGTLSVERPLTLSDGQVESLRLDADLTVQDQLQLSGDNVWSGGVIAADGTRPDPPLGELVITARADRLRISFPTPARRMQLKKGWWNSGTIIQESGSLQITATGRDPVELVNYTSAEYILLPGASIVSDGESSVTFVNLGTVRSVVSEEAPVDVAPVVIGTRLDMREGGAIEVGSGRLTLKRGGLYSGGTLRGPGVLEFGGGETVVAGALDLAEDVRLELSGGSLTISESGRLAVASAGDVQGLMIGAPVTVQGHLSLDTRAVWLEGAITAPGEFSNEGTLEISGPGPHVLLGTLINFGDLIVAPDAVLSLGPNAQLENVGTLTVHGTLHGWPDSIVQNDGVIRVLSPPGKYSLGGLTNDMGTFELGPSVEMTVARTQNLDFALTRRPLAGFQNDAQVLDGRNWIVHPGARLHLNGALSESDSIVMISRGTTLVLHGNGRLNNLPQSRASRPRFFNIGRLELRDGAVWDGGVFLQEGSLLIDESSEMLIDLSAYPVGQHVFKGAGGDAHTVVDGKLTVMNDIGTAPDDNRLLVPEGTLSGSGAVNGKPVEAFMRQRLR
ncbi:MAG: hypothetical protein WD273_09515 [Trueperaceae bacterium]